MFKGPIKIPTDSESIAANSFFTVRGVLAGKILYLGPTYNETISSHKANKTWKSEFGKLATKTAQGGRSLSDFKEDEAEYSKYILTWEDTHAKRFQRIDSRTSFGYRWSAEDEDDVPELDNLALGNDDPNEDESKEAEVDNSSDPRRFFAENSRIGFAPQGTKVGDLVYYFWDCEVAVVLRPLGGERGDRWKIIGRADLDQREIRETWAQKINEQALNFGMFSPFPMSSSFCRLWYQS